LESGVQKFDNFTLFNSKSERKKHEFGCRFYVGGEFLKYIKVFKITNERICYLRLKAKWYSCTLINEHAPRNEKMEEVKEEFHNLLEQNINQIANSDIKIILGDFNAKIGEEDIYKCTIGNECLHNETNNNEIKIIQLTISKGFNVGSTFPHKDIHQQTWYLADGRTANQIDRVLISYRLRSAITCLIPLRGPDIGSDHNLLKINFNL
jgi:exonuclease III